ncbi:LOW QUALITY PROTEIN: hypothetical protein HID58_054588, partial [Brassica napus]
QEFSSYVIRCCSRVFEPLLISETIVLDEKGKFDELVEEKVVRILVEPKSLMHVIGTKMDFIDDKLRYANPFVFINPNHQGQCGCGESFMTTSTSSTAKQSGNCCRTIIYYIVKIVFVWLTPEAASDAASLHLELSPSKALSPSPALSLHLSPSQASLRHELSLSTSLRHEPLSVTSSLSPSLSVTSSFSVTSSLSPSLSVTSSLSNVNPSLSISSSSISLDLELSPHLKLSLHLSPSLSISGALSITSSPTQTHLKLSLHLQRISLFSDKPISSSLSS